MVKPPWSCEISENLNTALVRGHSNSEITQSASDFWDNWIPVDAEAFEGSSHEESGYFNKVNEKRGTMHE